jgi:hypothetical protein
VGRHTYHYQPTLLLQVTVTMSVYSRITHVVFRTLLANYISVLQLMVLYEGTEILSQT